MKKLFILCLTILITGCTVSTNIEVTDELALEVAMDDSNTKPDDLIDSSVKRNDNNFEVTIETHDGTFVYYIDQKGWITDRTFEPAVHEYEEVEQEDTSNESDREKAINAALNNGNLTRSNVTQLNAQLNNGRWTVTFRVNNVLNTVEVEDKTFTVLSTVTE